MFPVTVESVVRLPEVAPDEDKVWFSWVPGTEVIAYRENPVLVAVKVTCPSEVLTTIVGRATHAEPE